MRNQVVFLALNEVNFEFVRHYVDRGELPTLGELIKKHSFVNTLSESKYEELEPWIQWVTAHTGMTLSEHGVFRLGDIVNTNIPQIWEKLEEQGCTVGAICPMNASNRLKNPAFFVPDPWTRTAVSGSPLLRRLSNAVAQVVGDNARGTVAVESVIALLAGLVRYCRVRNWKKYFSLILGAGSKPWYKAIFLDLFLTDIFLVETGKRNPDFSSIFLNAAAHIQHHYMFSSSAYSGTLRNPEWYISSGRDPVLDVYRIYDSIIYQVISRLPSARLLIATGLHQIPHVDKTFYWRLLDHAKLLRDLGIEFSRVHPLMSRDFLVECASKDDARNAAAKLEDSRDQAGIPIFAVDNRGTDLFVMLTYPKEFQNHVSYIVCGNEIRNMRSLVSFVALKNGRHHGTGYLIDTGVAAGGAPATMNLASIPDLIYDAVMGERARVNPSGGKWSRWPS